MSTTTSLPVLKEANVAVSPPSLLKFPLEIRHMIHSHVLGDGRNRWTPRGPSFPGNAFALDTGLAYTMVQRRGFVSLLLSCKQLRLEASSLLYHTVQIDLNGTRDPEKCLFNLGLYNIRLIKHLIIELRPGIKTTRARWLVAPEGAFEAWRALSILRFFQKAGVVLHTVTIKAPWHAATCAGAGAAYHTNCMDVDQLLRDPSVFSTVQTVIFPNFLVLAPSRTDWQEDTGMASLPPVRNRPLTQAQKDDIARRLGFRAETAGVVSCLRSAAPLPAGFFVVCNPCDLLTSKAEQLLPLTKEEWEELTEDHLVDLKLDGLPDIKIKWLSPKKSPGRCGTDMFGVVSLHRSSKPKN